MYNYIGPTWAKRSFDPPNIETTNFAKVWDLPYNEFIYLSAPPFTILENVRSELENFLPIVWVYSDPWGDIPTLTGIPHEEYIQREDWLDIWKLANKKILEGINSLGNPVFLIGTHCDVIDCNYENITVGYSSWQKFMADQLGFLKNNRIYIKDRVIDHCVAQEIYFRFFYENPNLTPAGTLYDLIIDQWMLWDEFYKTGIMYEHHPTKYSYDLFARFLKPKLVNWLDIHKI